jgi:hypothetical protein
MSTDSPTHFLRGDILEEAIKAIQQDRNSDYGDPEDNFGTIAEFWTSYLKAKYKGLLINDITLDPVDCAVMMVLLKVSRAAITPHVRDHWVDMGGYTGCAGAMALAQPSKE